MKNTVTNVKMLALAIAVIMVIMSTTTLTSTSLVTSNVFAASEKHEETDTQTEERDESNDDTESETETEEEVDSDTGKDETESESESESESETETETEVNEEQEQEEVAENNEDAKSGDVETLESAASNNPNGNDDVPGDNQQPNRVGSHDDQTSGEGANAGGTVTDPTIPGADGQFEDRVILDEVTANCFGKVISHEAQEHKDPESGEEPLGEHSSDPVPEIPGNETPRQGIGNQDQGHPAAHGAFNSNFDDDDAENVNENCDPEN